jgi:hypothetical protein
MLGIYNNFFISFFSIHIILVLTKYIYNINLKSKNFYKANYINNNICCFQIIGWKNIEYVS